MKTRIILPMCALAFSACVQHPGEMQTVSTIAVDGEERGNGTDYIGEEGRAAWFSGPAKSFSYCIASTPNFGISETEASKVIAEAIQMWGDYAKQRAPDSQIVFSGRLEPQCTALTDLKFDLGGSTPKGGWKGQQHVGMATRQSYDAKARWSRGTVWVAEQGSVQLKTGDEIYSKVFPNWSEANVLRAVILHELGHVFGNGHTAYTIMDSNLSNILAFKYSGSPNREYRSKYLEGIDGFQEVLPSEVHSGSLGLPSEPRFARSCAGNEKENFEFLTGVKPQGSISATFRPVGYKEYRLTIRDAVGSHDFSLVGTNVDIPGYSHSSSQRVFSELREDADGMTWNYGVWRNTGMRTLLLETRSKQRVFVSYYENSLAAFTDVDPPFAGYAAAGQVLAMNTTEGPRFLFISSLFLATSGGELTYPRDKVRSCP